MNIIIKQVTNKILLVIAVFTVWSPLASAASFIHVTEEIRSAGTTNTATEEISIQKLEDIKQNLYDFQYTPCTDNDGTIYDNTEGLAAFVDLLRNGHFSQTGSDRMILDIGGGSSDNQANFMRLFGYRFEVYDPYNRNTQHNDNALKLARENGGADIVTSMSVLNVIAQQEDISQHIQFVFDSLGPGAKAYFKVWAGMPGVRGIGAEIGFDLSSSQSNRFASSYLNDVKAVFGENNVQVFDNKELSSQNLLIAIKPRQIRYDRIGIDYKK